MGPPERPRSAGEASKPHSSQLFSPSSATKTIETDHPSDLSIRRETSRLSALGKSVSRALRSPEAILVLAFFALYTLAPRFGFPGDMAWWASWSTAIFDGGLGRAYQVPDLNYNPLFLYVLTLFGWTQGSAASINANVNHLKFVSLACDLGAVYLVVRLVRSLRRDPFLSLAILLNVAFLYNTLIWGQVDGIHTFLIFAAILAAAREWTILSVLLLVLALNEKSQSIVFLPQLLVLLVPQFLAKRVRIPLAAVGVAFLQGLILLPFALGGDIGRVLKVIAGAQDFYPVVSMNAFNFWHLLMTGNLADVLDTIDFWGISYKSWGLLLFALAVVAIMWPTAASELVRRRNRLAFGVLDYRIVFLSLSLSALAFFFFNTQMHERYVHPAILFAGISAILSRDYLYYFLVSLAYFLNLEKVMAFFNLDHQSWIFQSRCIAAVFLLALLLGFWRLYQAAGPSLWPFGAHHPKHAPPPRPSVQPE